MNAYSVKLAWQSSDLEGQTYIVSKTTSESDSSAATNIVPPSTSSRAEASTGSDTLSNSAKVAMGVGIPVTIIALTIVGMLLARKRRKAARMDRPQVEITSEDIDKEGTSPTSELDSQMMSELDSRMIDGPQELAGASIVIGQGRLDRKGKAQNVYKAWNPYENSM